MQPEAEAGAAEAGDEDVAGGVETALGKHMEMMETCEGTQKESGDYGRHEVRVEQIDLGTPSGSDEFFD